MLLWTLACLEHAVDFGCPFVENVEVLLVRLLLHNPTFSFPSFRCCATLAMVKRLAQQLPCFSRR
jgi:hypothetical protein